jgi:hypothetical protein
MTPVPDKYFISTVTLEQSAGAFTTKVLPVDPLDRWRIFEKFNKLNANMERNADFHQPLLESGEDAGRAPAA